MPMPLVCICVPCFNNVETVCETLDSILDQTYKNIVIKVVDNASEDGSYELLQKYASLYKNISVFRNEVTVSAGQNFTKCIEHMEGEFSAIFHSDDVYHPEIVEKSVDQFMNRNIDAVFSRALYIDENSQPIGKESRYDIFFKEEYVLFENIELLKKVLKYGNFLVTPSAIVKTKVYKEVVSIWRDEQFSYAADLDVWLRIAMQGKVSVLNSRLISYRRSSSSYSYRLLNIRVFQSPLIDVLDYYIRCYRSELNSKDICLYEVLKFKDQLILLKNKYLLKDKRISFPFPSLCVVKHLITSLSFMKHYLKSIGYYVRLKLFTRVDMQVHVQVDKF